MCWFPDTSGLACDISFLDILYRIDCFFYKDGGANVGVTNYLSHTICFSKPSHVKLSNRNTGYAQVIGIILYIFQTFLLYILQNQFISIQVTLSVPFHRVPLNVMLLFKKLRLNLLKNVILLTLKVVIGGHPIGYRTFWTVYRLRLSKSTLPETKIFWFQLFVIYRKIIVLNLPINVLVMSQLLDYEECQKKGWLRFCQLTYLTWNKYYLSDSWLKQLK